MDLEKFAGFYKKSVKERQELIINEFGLNKSEGDLLKKEGGLSFDISNRLIENVFSNFPLPLGLATNFIIDNKPVLIPFAIEEASVVAAASNAAKLSTGFITQVDEPIMIAQLQLINCDLNKAQELIIKNKKIILDELLKIDPILVKFGGGPRDIKTEIVKSKKLEMLDIHLLVDVRDAMGANAVNTMAEKISSKIELLTGGKVLLRILSNLAIYRRAQAKTIWTKEKLEESTKGLMKGSVIVDKIILAYEFAVASQFRTATHNKGIMNGIDSVVIATGNDFRAIEAGAHSFACFQGKYSPLTKFYKNKKGDLVGEIDIPLAVGLVGGATKIHPLAQINLKILGVKNANELSSIIASVGLAQNFAALRALSTTGIQEGHMKLHAKNIAVQAGATKNEIDLVAKKMIEQKEINQSKAEEILKAIKTK